MFSQVAESLRDGNSVKISVLGMSMIPFYKSGETITLQPINENALKIGNVILAKIRNNHYAVHRIIKINNNTITMLGDGNITPEIVDTNDIFGYIECNGWELKKAKIWYYLRPVRKYLLFIYKKVFRTHAN